MLLCYIKLEHPSFPDLVPQLHLQQHLARRSGIGWMGQAVKRPLPIPTLAVYRPVTSQLHAVATTTILHVSIPHPMNVTTNILSHTNHSTVRHCDRVLFSLVFPCVRCSLLWLFFCNAWNFHSALLVAVLTPSYFHSSAEI